MLSLISGSLSRPTWRNAPIVYISDLYYRYYRDSSQGCVRVQPPIFQGLPSPHSCKRPNPRFYSERPIRTISFRGRHPVDFPSINNLPSKRFKPPTFEESALHPRSNTSRGFHITHPEFQRDIVVRTNITELYKPVAQKGTRGISRFMVGKPYLPL